MTEDKRAAVIGAIDSLYRLMDYADKAKASIIEALMELGEACPHDAPFIREHGTGAWLCRTCRKPMEEFRVHRCSSCNYLPNTIERKWGGGGWRLMDYQDSCEHKGKHHEWYDTPQEAIDAWNSRQKKGG